MPSSAIPPSSSGKATDDAWVEANPVPVTMPLLERGRQRYEIYCSPCHGLAGLWRRDGRPAGGPAPGGDVDAADLVPHRSRADTTRRTPLQHHLQRHPQHAVLRLADSRRMTDGPSSPMSGRSRGARTRPSTTSPPISRRNCDSEAHHAQGSTGHHHRAEAPGRSGDEVGRSLARSSVSSDSPVLTWWRREPTAAWTICCRPISCPSPFFSRSRLGALFFVMLQHAHPRRLERGRAPDRRGHRRQRLVDGGAGHSHRARDRASLSLGAPRSRRP